MSLPSRGRADHAEPHPAIRYSVALLQTETVRGATAAWLVEPAAAAHHPEKFVGEPAAQRALGRPLGIDARAVLVVIRIVPIGAPLRDVAVHVVQAPGVRSMRADLDGLLQKRPFSRSAIGIKTVAVGLHG